MADTPTDAHIVIAEHAAAASGAVLRRYFRTALAVDDKEDTTPVTAADRDAEAAIRAVLAAEAPGHGVIGEEHGAERAGAEHVWVVDPIDGTRSFITGRPLFGTLIALLHRGAPVLGLIDQPVTGERWLGVAGRPTLFNGRPARSRDVARLDRALLGTTSPALFSGADAARFARLSAAVKDTVFGGDCYAYGLLACGWLDLVAEAGLKLHDFAALAPVVTGAGGCITDWAGRPLGAGSDGRVLAAGGPAIHARALAALAGG